MKKNNAMAMMPNMVNLNYFSSARNSMKSVVASTRTDSRCTNDDKSQIPNASEVHATPVRCMQLPHKEHIQSDQQWDVGMRPETQVHTRRDYDLSTRLPTPNIPPTERRTRTAT